MQYRKQHRPSTCTFHTTQAHTHTICLSVPLALNHSNHSSVTVLLLLRVPMCVLSVVVLLVVVAQMESSRRSTVHTPPPAQHPTQLSPIVPYLSVPSHLPPHVHPLPPPMLPNQGCCLLNFTPPGFDFANHRQAWFPKSHAALSALLARLLSLTYSISTLAALKTKNLPSRPGSLGLTSL